MPDDSQEVAEVVEVVENGEETNHSVADMSPEELQDVISQAVAGLSVDTANAVADAVASSGEQASTVGAVTLDDSQYSELRNFMATDLHGTVVAVGLLSLLLGAVVATALTLHWRGARG